jgi:mono/diheme cytochrome c family protein
MIGKARMIKRGTAVIVGAGLVLGTAVSVTHAEDGQAIFQKNCVACHGAAGKGDGPAAKALKPPPGDFATTLASMGDADVAKFIADGGKAAGKKHPAFAGKLSDDQVKAVAQFVKTLK